MIFDRPTTLLSFLSSFFFIFFVLLLSFFLSFFFLRIRYSNSVNSSKKQREGGEREVGINYK